MSFITDHVTAGAKLGSGENLLT